LVHFHRLFPEFSLLSHNPGILPSGKFAFSFASLR